jgi:hypothetical protein
VLFSGRTHVILGLLLELGARPLLWQLSRCPWSFVGARHLPSSLAELTLFWLFASWSLLGVGCSLFAPAGLAWSWLFACPSLLVGAGSSLLFELRALFALLLDRDFWSSLNAQLGALLLLSLSEFWKPDQQGPLSNRPALQLISRSFGTLLFRLNVPSGALLSFSLLGCRKPDHGISSAGLPAGCFCPLLELGVYPVLRGTLVLSLW